MIFCATQWMNFIYTGQFKLLWKYLLKGYIFHVSCREKLEDELEKEARYRQLMAHSSHDSAIDTDSMEWETEVVEFEKHRVRTI